MAVTGTEAYEAIRAHHRTLGEGLAERANDVSATAAAGRPHATAVAGFIAYLAEEVLTHAAAEEQTIYPAVAARTDLGGMIGEMIAEHALMAMSAARLAVVTDGAAAAEQTRRIAELFTAHAARENDVLLPSLLADQDVDLAELLSRMHHSLDQASAASERGLA
jgi:iron-sulfur cluster repair protein YtfE (RIC family)